MNLLSSLKRFSRHSIRKLKTITAPIPFSLWLVNMIFQRIFRINGNVHWMVHFTSTVKNATKIKIGANVEISFAVSGGCYFQGFNGIEIGDNSIFAPGVKMISANHIEDDLENWKRNEPIRIGKNCWIGANAVILPGVHLGDGCIVGAGSVVTKGFPTSSIIMGVPAVLKKTTETSDHQN